VSRRLLVSGVFGRFEGGVDVTYLPGTYVELSESEEVVHGHRFEPAVLTVVPDALCAPPLVVTPEERSEIERLAASGENAAAQRLVLDKVGAATVPRESSTVVKPTPAVAVKAAKRTKKPAKRGR